MRGLDEQILSPAKLRSTQALKHLLNFKQTGNVCVDQNAKRSGNSESLFWGDLSTSAIVDQQKAGLDLLGKFDGFP